MSFNGQLSAILNYGATEAQVQAALEALSTIGAGNIASVVRSDVQTTTQNGPGAPNTGFLYTVTFGGTLANTIIPLTASGQAGTAAAGSVVATGGVDVRVANGTTLELTSPGTGFTVSDHHLTLSGIGMNGDGGLHNVAGDNVWDGPVNLLADTSIGAELDTTLALAGGVSVAGPGLDITKIQEGTLIFAAGSPANNQASTVVSDGTVQVDGIIGNVLLDSGILSGTGTVGTITSTSNGGTVEPGDTVPTSAIGRLRRREWHSESADVFSST